MKIGLREANVHFSKYVSMVKNGKEIVLTERGMPIATIKPLPQGASGMKKRIKLLEEKGLLRCGKKGKFPLHKPVVIKGGPISETVTTTRAERL
jgi:antitoxin (DNA-binding transcriptional repressor) of toxin-antitoxin stability system